MNKPTNPHPNYQYGWSLLTNDYLSQIEHYLYNANLPDPTVLQFPSFLDHLFRPFPNLQEIYVILRWSPNDRLQRHQVRDWLTRTIANMPRLAAGQWQLMVASLTLVEIMQYIVDNWDLHNPHWIPKEHLSPAWVALDQIVTDERVDFPLTEIVDNMGKGDELQEKARKDTAAIQTLRDELAKRVGEDQVSPVLTKVEGIQVPVQGAEGNIHHIDLDPEVVKSEKLRDELTDAFQGTSKEETELEDSPIVTECRKAVEDHISYTASLRGTSKEEIELTERALDLKFQTRDLKSDGDTAATPDEKAIAKKKLFDEIERQRDEDLEKNIADAIDDKVAKKKIFDDIEASSQASRLNALHKREAELEEIYILTTKEMQEVGGAIFELQNPGYKASDYIRPQIPFTYESLTRDVLLKMLRDLFDKCS